ncbi:hypothetical protein VPH35_105726 [Triticum aestivum]
MQPILAALEVVHPPPSAGDEVRRGAFIHASPLPTHLGRRRTVVAASRDETGNASACGQRTFKARLQFAACRHHRAYVLSVNKSTDHSTYTMPLHCLSFKISCMIIRQKPVI